MGKPAAGQLQHHQPSKMTAPQVQHYIDLLVEKHEALGVHYVARQLDWAVAELGRVEGRV
jgi:hypothetical protein